MQTNSKVRWWSALAAVGALSLAFMPGARASVLHFSYTQTGGSNIYFSFDQNSNPTPLSTSPTWNYDYTQAAITNWSGNIAAVSSVYWYGSNNGGMFTLPASSSFTQNLIGDVVFTGTLKSPVFQPGVYSGSYTVSSGGDSYFFGDCGGQYQNTQVTGTLTVTAMTSSVPEPGTLALFAAALGLLALAARRRARR